MLCRMGMLVRDQLEDICVLRKVHCHAEKKDGLTDESQEKYKQDAVGWTRVKHGHGGL